MWFAIGGLLVSILALWRAGRVRVLDLRTTLRKDAAELRLALGEDLAATIPRALQSRSAVAAATGQAGALQVFRTEAEADSATVAALRARLGAIEPIPLLASYSAIEGGVVTTHEVRIRVQQLREKYTAPAAADAQEREHLRAAAEARVRAARNPKAWG